MGQYVKAITLSSPITLVLACRAARRRIASVPPAAASRAQTMSRWLRGGFIYVTSLCITSTIRDFMPSCASISEGLDSPWLQADRFKPRPRSPEVFNFLQGFVLRLRYAEPGEYS